MDFRDALKVVDALSMLAQATADGTTLRTLISARDEAAAEQKKLADLQESERTLRRERAQLEKDRAAHSAQVSGDKEALASQYSALEREQRLHREAAQTLAAERAEFDAVHNDYLRFKQLALSK